LADLVELGPVDVDVNDLGPGGEGGTFPVTRSSKRAPSEIKRSLFWMAVTAVYMPCIPGMPRCCSCESGNAPRAINVVTTGMPVRSAKASNSWAARDFSVPPPT